MRRLAFGFGWVTVLLLSSAALGATNDAFIQGQSEYGAGNFEGAIDSFSRALQVEPNRHEALYKLALSYREARQILKAIDAYKRLERFRNLYPDLDFETAKLYYNTQDFPNAFASFKKAEKQPLHRAEAEYFLAYIRYLTNDRVDAKKRFFRIERTSKNKEHIQGAKLYLATMLFDDEKPGFEKNGFKKSKAKLEETIDVDGESPIAEAAKRKQAEIESLIRAAEPTRAPRRLSAYVTQDFEYDSNVLNENANTTTPTNATAIKFNTIANGKYRVYDSTLFYFHPGLTVNFTKNLANKESAQEAVSKSDSAIVTGSFFMGSKKEIEGIGSGLTEIKAQQLEISYPAKVAVTYNDANGDQIWSMYTIAPSFSPSVKFQFFQPNYTTIGLDYTYSHNRSSSDLTTQSLQGNFAQSYLIIPGLLDSVFSSSLTYTMKSNDKAALNLGESVTYFAPWQIAVTGGFNFTATRNFIQTDKGWEELFGATLSANRSFFGFFAVNVHYAYDHLLSGAPSSEYAKHRVGIKGTVSY